MPEEITTTTTVYEFEELGEEAQERALQHFADVNVDDSFWHEPLTEVNSNYDGDFQYQARQQGFELSAFYFSGFSMQGDGASFEASVDYEDYILANKLGNEYRTLLNHVRRDGGGLGISTSGGYSHSNTMHVDTPDRFFNPADDAERAWKAADKAEKQAEELIDVILDHARSLADDFYRTLEREYDYQTSEDQVKDWIEANEVRFLEDGTPY